MTLHLAEVAAAVAALDIPGIAVLGLNEMPQALTNRPLPLLAPSSHEPSFLTDWEAVRLTTQGNYRNSYTLNYKLFQASAGKDRGLFTQYPEMVANAQKVVDAFQAIVAVAGCKRIELAAMPQFGPVPDSSGQIYHGAVISLRITEF